ncbi:MAG: hypothetical protein ABIH03_16505 [Pseudomonadota bacterium]
MRATKTARFTALVENANATAATPSFLGPDAPAWFLASDRLKLLAYRILDPFSASATPKG